MQPDSKRAMDAELSSQEPEEQVTSEQAVDNQQDTSKAQDQPQAASPLPEYVTPGNMLRTAREKEGYNRARIGQGLGLTETAVKNLETNSFDQFPGGVYVRGYLRNYARLLCEDEQEVIDVFDRYCADHQMDNGKIARVPRPVPVGETRSIKISTFLGLLLLAALVLVAIGILI